MLIIHVVKNTKKPIHHQCFSETTFFIPINIMIIMDHLWLALLWIGFFVIHSLLAETAVKEYFYKKGLSRKIYRLIFSLISTITLAIVITYSSLIPSEYLIPKNQLLKVIGLMLSAWGVIIFRETFKSYNLKAFLGLGNMETEDEFTTKGLLSKVRHPLYSASILLIIGYFMFSPKWSTAISGILMTLYFLIGIQLEERKLIKQFGEKYISYKKQTPMLIPRLGKNKKSPEVMPPRV